MKIFCMPTLAKTFLVLFFVSVLLSCSESDDEETYMPDFTFTEDVNDANKIVFSNTSTGSYLFMQWDFGNDETSEKSSDISSTRTAYYPLAGTYEVTLTIWGSLNSIVDTQSISKTITIESDDPDYDTSETLVWSDEFNNSSINTDYWTFETGSGGWGNNELQNYTDGDNASIEDGVLIITAKKVNDNNTAGSYTSTRLISWGKEEFTYGRMEIRAKLPSGTGVWPAIWMLGANLSTAGWPACGEMDIMEYVGYDPYNVHSSLHTTSSSGSTTNTSTLRVENCEEEFNVYGMIWTEESISFYINDQDNPFYTYAPTVKTEEKWPFDEPQFFILNLAVGGNWGGVEGIDNDIFPQTLEIDYVRVYQ